MSPATPDLPTPPDATPGAAAPGRRPAVRPAALRFGPYRLDEAEARLTCDGRVVDLPPKAFDVLCALARQAGRLISKDDLLDAAWGRRFITEGVLKTVVSELRAVLGDDARAPRWIETVPRRGYRFVGAVEHEPASEPAAAAAAVAAPPDEPAGGPPAAPWPAAVAPRAAVGAAPDDEPLVGRGPALATLHAAWADALAGRRRLVLVAGEPGMGKSALIDAFVSGLDDARVGAGQCVEQIGAGEPYLPMLDALAACCAQEPATVEALRCCAPTWLVQLPWLVSAAEREALNAQLRDASRDRMLREMAVLLDTLAAEHPLLLVLEDLHWSDAATVQLLDALARRRGAARLMIVASFRPTTLIVEDHPLVAVRREWRLHNLGQELVLDGLDVPQVRAWLDRRLGGDTGALDDAWVLALQRHTEGLPLFLLGVLDELLETGELYQHAGRWHLRSGDRRTLPVPSSLSGVLDRQIERLPAATRMLLEAASLSAASFHHLQLADVLGMDATLVQTTLDGLVRRQLWLRAAGTERLADGSLGVGYAFRHGLFRHAFAARVPPGDRLRLHGRMADALELRHGSCCVDLVAELAWHAEGALQPQRAGIYLAQAAALALDRHDPTEALLLTERGLAALQAADPSMAAPAWPALLALRLRALMTRDGYSAPTTLAAARQTQAGLDRLPVHPGTIALWHAVWWSLSNAGDATAAAALVASLARRMASAAAAPQAPAGEPTCGSGCTPDAADAAEAPVVQAAARLMQGIVALRAGRTGPALDALTEAWSAFEAFGPADRAARFVQDLGIEIASYLALAAELAGHHGLAAQRLQDLRDRIDAGLDPLSEAIAWWFLAYAAHVRADAQAMQAASAQAARLYEARGVLPGAPHRMTLGWARAALGDADGAALAAEGLARYVDEGSRLSLTPLRVATAEALWRTGRIDAAQAALGLARQEAADDPNLVLRPELDRIAGRLRRAVGDADGARRLGLEALHAARAQGAILLELAAALDLADDLAADGKLPQAATALEAVVMRLPADAGGPRVQAARDRLRRWRGERGDR